MAFYNVEFFDRAGRLDHNGVMTLSEILEAADGRPYRITGVVADEQALAMTREERGLLDRVVLEETVGLVNGRLQWALCLPGGGDVVAEMAEYLPPEEQERIVKAIVKALSK